MCMLLSSKLVHSIYRMRRVARPGIRAVSRSDEELTTRRNIMLWTDIAAGTLNAALQRFLVGLGRQAFGVVLRINTDPDYLAQLTRFATSPWPKSTTLQSCSIRLNLAL